MFVKLLIFTRLYVTELVIYDGIEHRALLSSPSPWQAEGDGF